MREALRIVMTQSTPAGQRGNANLRTALILLSIVAVFFAWVIVNRWLFGA